MDIVKCCCCCCFGPKPDLESSNQPEVVVTKPPPPPHAAVPVQKQEETEVDLVVIAQENEIDMTSSLPVTSTMESGKEDTKDDVSPQVTLRAPNEASAGSTVDVEWCYNTTTDLNTDHSNNTDTIAMYPHGEKTIRSSYTYTRNGSPGKLLLPTKPGSYTIAYVSGNDHRRLSSIDITLVPPNVSLTAPETAHVGATIDVPWIGPNESSDTIAICPVHSNIRSNYTYTSTGTPVKLLLPTKPGSYQIHYMAGQDHHIFASRPIQLLPVEASITVPSEASIGSTVLVEWTGPNYASDHIAIYDSTSNSSNRIQYVYTSTGNPANLLMPTKVGMYDIKYVVGQDNSILTTTPIKVVAVDATLSSPSEGRAGSVVDVSWTGPNYAGDYVSIQKEHTKERLHYAYTSTGNPVRMTLPTKSGLYEFKYCIGQDNSTLATTPISVVEETATLSGPSEGPVGGIIEVAWTGPDNSGDYVGISKVGAKDALHYAYTSSGSPANVQLPTRAGSYELKYYMGQDNSVLVKSPIIVTAVTATLMCPSEGQAGSTIEVTWSGPDNSGDYIGISKVGAKDALHYAYTSSGNPANVQLPTIAGSYELKYYMGQDNYVLVKSPIIITAVTATLTCPSDGRAGSTMEVVWSGPDNSGDYIGISKVGAKEALHYAYTSCGNPASITLPSRAGSYELKYYMGQDNGVLVKSPINVTAVTATLSAPTSGKAGSTVEVEWTGPDYSGDYVGIGKVGAKESLHYAYTSSGNPAYVMLPTSDGLYELKYYMGQDNIVLVKSPITVVAETATLSGPSEGPVGGIIEVAWTGPDNSGDYIGISKAGAKESLHYAYTSSGNPVNVSLPSIAGSYELKYYMGQDNSVLASASFTVA